jgi:hypothetical protein
MKIALTNKTHYRDDHIRAFIKRGIREERPDLCKRGARPMKVEIVYTRPGGRTGLGAAGSSGLGSINGNWIRVRLPKNHAPDRIDFASVIAHELAHTRGMRDEYMMRHSARYGRVGSWRAIYAWAETLPLEIQPRKSKTRPAPDVKLTHAETMLKAAMTREKRAKTIRMKWERKIKYYRNRTELALAAQTLA